MLDISKVAFILLLAAIASAQDCYVRKCDQQISGRGLSYTRSLEIVQNEEYLSEADTNVIKKRKREAQFGGLLSSVDSVASTASEALDVPLPGQPGGGAPFGSLGNALESLASTLAPIGTTLISIFPPFSKPRTYKAVATLFEESDEESRQGRQFGSLGSIGGKLISTAKDTASQATSALSGFKLKDDVFDNYESFSNINLGELSSFTKDDIDLTKKFGFGVLVQLVDEVCDLGVTCDIDGNKLEDGEKVDDDDDDDDDDETRRRKRDTGEEYESRGPPECRTVKTSGDQCSERK